MIKKIFSYILAIITAAISYYCIMEDEKKMDFCMHEEPLSRQCDFYLKKKQYPAVQFYWRIF